MNLTKLRNALSLFDRFRPLKRPQFPVSHKLASEQTYNRALLVNNRRDVDRESALRDSVASKTSPIWGSRRPKENGPAEEAAN